jgi:hypothetical protein
LGLANLLYVVRQVEGEPARYLLLGECYRDGIMDGQMADMRAEQELYVV